MNATPIQLTREESEKLVSLLAQMNGALQYRAMKQPDGSLDDSWKFWNGIEKKVAESIGFQAFLQPSSEVDNLLNRS